MKQKEMALLRTRKRAASSIAKAGVSIMILFLIGMLSGAWMIGGVVPTLICYGVSLLYHAQDSMMEGGRTDVW